MSREGEMWLSSLIYKRYRPGINVKQMEREVLVLDAPLWSSPFRFILCQKVSLCRQGVVMGTGWKGCGFTLLCLKTRSGRG